MSSFVPTVEPAVLTLAPGFRALSLFVDAKPVAASHVAAEAALRAANAVKQGGPAWAEQHLAAWAETFRAFGAKPQRTPCSAEALRKRVLRDGTLPAVDPVVDLYNAISVEFAVPIGGENVAAYQGAPRLVVAEGTEPFDTMKDGHQAIEFPEAGEVVWRDDHGVTCRRWNWRQGVRTRLHQRVEQMWFVLEALPQMPDAALRDAGEALAQDLIKMMPGSIIRTELTASSAY